MNCGTVSDIAWPILQKGISASVTISDHEAHQDVQYLRKNGVEAGPCGGGTLAALRRLVSEAGESMNIGPDTAIVILCTEGYWEYDTPRDVSLSDVTSLTQQLVRIASVNPDLDVGGSEKDIAQYISSWFQHRGMDTHWLEDTPGRPSVVAVAKGSGGGRSLMLNGHIDTVSTGAYTGNPFSGDIKEGKIYGRGVQDMKAGVAAMMIATAAANEANLKGDVIFAGVADEENLSTGTEELLKKGWKADAAIIPEPTDEKVLIGHRGFVWLDVTFEGVAAHGSRRDLGTDAIVHAGLFLTELKEYDERLNSSGARKHSGMGHGSVHAGLISGGVEISSYPALCKLSIERRTLPDESSELVEGEVKEMLEDLASRYPGFKYKLEITFHRPAFEIPDDHPFLSAALDVMSAELGSRPDIGYGAFWTDAALLSDAGVPVFVYGVKGGSYVDAE